jgi:hypothetical protein
MAGCKDTGTEVIRQERQDSGSTRPTIIHNDNVNFLVNIHSLHNCKAIRRLLSNRPDCFALLQSPLEYLGICKDAAALLQGIRSKNAESDLDNGEEGKLSFTL